MVAAAAALAAAPSLGNGFALDDVAQVRDNPAIRSVAGIPRLFTRPYWDVPGEQHGLYRPVTVAAFTLNRAATGESPAGFHAVNVGLHALVAALAWFAFRRAGTHYGTAFFGGLLFATHAVHVEAFANVTGRSELLAAAGVLAAWLAHRRGRPGLAATAWFAALLSKESAVLAPALFALDDALRPEAERPRRAWRAYAAALVAAIALRVVALGGLRGADSAIFLDNPAAAAGTAARVATALWCQVLHLGLFLWPQPLVSDYSFDAIPVVRSLSDPRAWAGAAFAAGFVAACGLAWRRRSRPVLLALALWGLFFLPSSNLLLATGTIFGERQAYLPSLGACLLVGHAAATLRARRGVVAAAVIVASVALAARGWARIPAWKDNLTLATTDVTLQPRSAKLQAGAGMFLEEAGQDAAAEAALARAVAIWPDYAQARYNLAVLLARRGARDEAIAHLERVVALAPSNPRPYALLDRLKRGQVGG
jgi:tetratricopeptide (TPR) repeat protein